MVVNIMMFIWPHFHFKIMWDASKFPFDCVAVRNLSPQNQVCQENCIFLIKNQFNLESHLSPQQGGRDWASDVYKPSYFKVLSWKGPCHLLVSLWLHVQDLAPSQGSAQLPCITCHAWSYLGDILWLNFLAFLFFITCDFFFFFSFGSELFLSWSFRIRNMLFKTQLKKEFIQENAPISHKKQT